MSRVKGAVRNKNRVFLVLNSSFIILNSTKNDIDIKPQI